MLIVKRHGKKETYDVKKTYGSVMAAALNSHYSETDAEHLADYITQKVSDYMKAQKEVDSVTLRKLIADYIPDRDVVLMYKSHLDIC